MGANNSTCLPCKVAGGNARRNKPLNGVHDPKNISRQVQVLKKVSTAADPQGTNGTVLQSATPLDSSANGTSSPSEPLQRRSENLQLQGQALEQSHSEVSQQPAEGQRMQHVGELQDDPPLHEGKTRPGHEPDLLSNQECSAGIPSPQPKELTTVGEQQLRDGSPKPQQHIHVPSHMLAAGAEMACIKHQGTQQALLSPHSCSVAHKVAAALRAAAGERAAAAAARAAEAAEAAKAMPKQHAGQPKEACTLQTQSPSSDCRALRSATRSTAENTAEKQANAEQETQRTLPQNSCFPPVSCFSTNDESASEITVRHQAEQYEGKPIGFSSPEQSLISAAKLVGEMFSGAAAAAVAMASSTSQHGCDSAEEPVSTNTEKCLVAGHTRSDKGGDLQEGAVVLLGAVDRAMDAITSDEFKKQASSAYTETCTSNMLADTFLIFCRVQLTCLNVLQAVTLLSQSISVAASVVEAVKTCGDSTQQQGELALPEFFTSAYFELGGVFPPANPVNGVSAVYPSCAAGYYEALRMSAQQQLSEGAIVHT
ncbi:hypothetical protein, conserved [Eimeria brunetti]|uniref:Uncharacterized protein n=1 Tax=Eimeria brunetti TaxID=51314 RepID=U6LV93_9EIME|nr:hypothetical protein, conserved [Eimeria brunetti]